ncbi:FAD:protein FMN transferase [Kitasatospora kifunensis]|uniref:FAD:protein FMN transferase n=1 Tax=Kitasatospora kifunensis TaxID=58351 RepID=A0A7W7R5T2_KITKI|nr:FAD:protein FMN transferase [Kitasatospora kifunensis]MBB4925774.1 thiamine biosynthesis lipoprotein [Kitasatospora kifunensis]
MLRHAESAMGTVFSFAVRDADPGQLDILGPALAELHRLDALFSPYLPHSELSRLARGELTTDQCDPLVGEALAHCAAVATETGGWFTAHPGGRLDPSGWVKGWAIERASDLLLTAGYRHHSVTGGGDVQTRGEAAPGQPWRVGVADPTRAGFLAAVLAGQPSRTGQPSQTGQTGRATGQTGQSDASERTEGFAVATSGTAERGEHIVDPKSGGPARGLLSLTLVGPRLARTDAYATAAFAMGPLRALDWVTAKDGYEALAVLPDGRRLGTPGVARYLVEA